MSVENYLAGLADYPNNNEADVAQSHVYHSFDAQVNDVFSYDLQLFNAAKSSSPVTVEFDPDDGSGLTDSNSAICRNTCLFTRDILPLLCFYVW